MNEKFGRAAKIHRVSPHCPDANPMKLFEMMTKQNEMTVKALHGKFVIVFMSYCCRAVRISSNHFVSFLIISSARLNTKLKDAMRVILTNSNAYPQLQFT